ncbi:MAG: hypothetical protein FVQ83_17055 [Chloroflexi bacterium]|nr:hypothetical protein [Chloroflexota bacterium]
MTYQNDCTLPEEILEQIATDGLDAIPELIRILVNEAMRLEREQHLGMVVFLALEIRDDTRIGAVVMRVGVLLGALVVIQRSRASEA